MNYLTGIALGMWLVVFPVAVLLLVRHDRSQERAWEDERPEWAPGGVLPQRVRVDTSFAAHPSAVRIADLIAANEAARIDDEWEAMNR